MVHSYTEGWSVSSDQFPGSGSLTDQIRFCLQYAILAPSTHNSQPWLFEILPDGCRIYADSTKILKEADPIGRDRFISLGCAIKNFEIAAAHFGLFATVEYEQKEGQTCARIQCVPNRQSHGSEKSLFSAIIRRRNSRIFISKPLEPTFLKDLGEFIQTRETSSVRVHVIENEEKKQKIAELTGKGVALARDSQAFRREFASWFYHNAIKRDTGIPGYAVGMPNLIARIMAFCLPRFSLGSLLSRLNKKSVMTAGATVVITSAHESPRVWMDIGRLAEELMLFCVSRGLGVGVFVAAIEMGELRSRVREVIESPLAPQFLFVTGSVHGLADTTPRRTLENSLYRSPV